MGITYSAKKTHPVNFTESALLPTALSSCVTVTIGPQKSADQTVYCVVYCWDKCLIKHVMYVC
jgi:hypothetical protein